MIMNVCIILFIYLCKIILAKFHYIFNKIFSIYFLIISSVNGQWGEWTAWTACDKASCGHQSRERQCDSPAPEFKGDYCVGEANETQWCNTDPCEGIHNQVFSLVILWCMVIDLL